MEQGVIEKQKEELEKDFESLTGSFIHLVEFVLPY